MDTVKIDGENIMNTHYYRVRVVLKGHRERFRRVIVSVNVATEHDATLVAENMRSMGKHVEVFTESMPTILTLNEALAETERAAAELMEKVS